MDTNSLSTGCLVKKASDSAVVPRKGLVEVDVQHRGVESDQHRNVTEVHDVSPEIRMLLLGGFLDAAMQQCSDHGLREVPGFQQRSGQQRQGHR